MDNYAMQNSMKRARLDGPAPANYVPGIGRGASGFTTNIELGAARNLDSLSAAGKAPPPAPLVSGGGPPARNEPNFGQAPPNYVAGRGRGMGAREWKAPASKQKAPAKSDAMDDDDEKKEGGGGEEDPAFNDNKFDEWSGFSDKLFSDMPYEADDLEADKIYSAIDEKMEARGKAYRDAKAKRKMAELQQQQQSQVSKVLAAAPLAVFASSSGAAGSSNAPKLQQQFADLKKELSSVSYDEWMNIPDAVQLARKQRQKQEVFAPPPDAALESLRKDGDRASSIDPKNGAVTDVSALGTASRTALSTKLGQVADSISGQTVVDAKGYLTSLDGRRSFSESDIGDIKRARLLYKSMTQTNPQNASGWIAAARLEEFQGRLVAARNIISQGCEACPTNEDIWTEAARLQTPDAAKGIMASAVQHIPKSVKLWLQATALEQEKTRKKRVLRRALEMIPNSVKLWMEAVRLEEEEDAKIMLARAVECVPDSTDLWLALARLESYENAKKVLNRARAALPTDPSIWIAAAKLEETRGNEASVEKIVGHAVRSLTDHQVVIGRDKWLSMAEEAEKSGNVKTCQSIVKLCAGIGVELEDRYDTFMADAARFASKEDHMSEETARALYTLILSLFSDNEDAWLAAARFEMTYGSSDQLDALLQRAVGFCPRAEILWLMAAKEKWRAGNVDAARSLLQSSFAVNPLSEKIWLAAVKLESEVDEIERARSLLANARERANTKRVWMKSAILERQCGRVDEEREILNTALEKYPDFDKLWMMRGQWEERHGSPELAHALYIKGVRNCPNSVPLWLCAIQHEEKRGNVTKARSLVEMARVKNPTSPQLWLKAIRLEFHNKNVPKAQEILARALRELPENGLLWAEAIEMEARPQKRARSKDALHKNLNDPWIISAVAKLFWAERKPEKARSWFSRAATLNADLGDTWIQWFKFELQNGTEAQQQEVVDKCKAANPRHGEQWMAVSKDPRNQTVGGCRLSTEEILRAAASH